MDRTVMDRKLESLRRCLARVRQRRPATVELLADFDRFAQAVVAWLDREGSPD